MNEITGTTASIFTKCSHPEYGDSTFPETSEQTYNPSRCNDPAHLRLDNAVRESLKACLTDSSVKQTSSDLIYSLWFQVIHLQ